jgi:hypothetical protein
MNDLRPMAVLMAYWDEVINIELGAVVLPPVYLEVSNANL